MRQKKLLCISFSFLFYLSIFLPRIKRFLRRNKFYICTKFREKYERYSLQSTINFAIYILLSKIVCNYSIRAIPCRNTMTQLSLSLKDKERKSKLRSVSTNTTFTKRRKWTTLETLRGSIRHGRLDAWPTSQATVGNNRWIWSISMFKISSWGVTSTKSRLPVIEIHT